METSIDKSEWIEKLKREGFSDIRVCPLPPNIDTDEHTHDRHTVHIILSGKLTISDNSGTKIYRPSDRVEFPAGTTHKAKGSGNGEMIVGVKTAITFKSRHVSVSINRSADQVYEFASNPKNLPKWAAGLSGSIKKINDDWIAESPMGRIKVKFAGKNKFGILDHDVILPSGEKVYNPMHVFPNNDGSELIFTLYQRPDMSDKMFEDDAKLVKMDLEKLKTLLETLENSDCAISLL